jgi:hypothetical protein
MRLSVCAVAVCSTFSSAGCVSKSIDPEVVLWAVSNKSWEEVADCLHSDLTTRKGFVPSEVALTKDAAFNRASILVQGSEKQPIVAFDIYRTGPETHIEYRTSGNEHQAAVIASRSLLACKLSVALTS